MHSKPEITDDMEMVEAVPLHESTEYSALERRPGDGALVFTIHDGAQIPRHLFGERSEEVIARPEVEAAFVHERDWGANLVARHLAQEIDASSYLRINLARVVMDFGRFPGCSSVGMEYLRRHAIFPPLEHFFAEEDRHRILGRYYDGASQAFVQHIADKQLTIAVHSYDPRNATGTRRPEVGLVARSLEYQLHSTMPPYIFDPLFPPELCESTCQRLLTYQALADLERGGWHTALNYPYIMPEGSVEIRAQVWLFFRYLRDCFTRALPETRDRPGYQRVWHLLLDVVRRSADAERLRGYLHRYREAPADSRRLFAEARAAYGEIAAYLAAHRDDLLAGYRFSGRRTSCLGIEVRKDLLCEIDSDRNAVRLRDDAESTARQVAACLAPAVKAYLAEHSRPAAEAEAPVVGEAGGWYPPSMPA